MTETFSNRARTIAGVKIKPKWAWSKSYAQHVSENYNAKPDTPKAQNERARKYNQWLAERGQSDNTQDLLASLANDLRPMVNDVETGIKTTQDHYGQYMSILHSLAGNDKRKAQIIAKALILAGANKNGVYSALQVSF